MPRLLFNYFQFTEGVIDIVRTQWGGRGVLALCAHAFWLLKDLQFLIVWIKNLLSLLFRNFTMVKVEKTSLQTKAKKLRAEYYINGPEGFSITKFAFLAFDSELFIVTSTLGDPG